MIYTDDENNEKVLLSSENEQIMMEWEKPYMEESIDFLSPKGDVLEIGFGCGYSATQILKHPIKSYTIIECEPEVIKKIEEWKKDYTTKITLVEGRWQEKLNTLGVFDEIYFDDYPLDLNSSSSGMDVSLSNSRSLLFIDLCIQFHTRIGSKISMYLNNNREISIGSDSKPFITIDYKSIEVKIPSTCKYRNLEEQKCSIPLITKVKDYNFEEAQGYALDSLKNGR